MTDPQPDTDTLREKVRELPGKPGIYRFSDSKGDVIYVGKAKHLKKRVSSYFTKQAGVSPKVLSMVAQICDVAVTILSLIHI